MATNKGQFSDRTRTYHRTPATSAPGYKVKDIIDQAYRRLNEPSLNVTGSAGDNRLANGIFALRGLLDTINADPTLYQPPEYVSYTIPIQPSLTWGLGGWDIDDQPPLEIKSLWFSSENTSYEYGAFGQLTEMSMADLARYRDLRRYEFTNYEPRRFFFEKTWPIRRLHFDINLGRDNTDLTARADTASVLWRSGNVGVGTSESAIEAMNFFNINTQTDRAQFSITFRQVVGFEEAFIDFGGGVFSGVIHRTQPDNAPTIFTGVVNGFSNIENIGEGDTSVLRFVRSVGGGPPVELYPSTNPTGILNGFIVKAFALPMDDNRVANYDLRLPPGYFEYILCGLAIRLSSLSSKPLPQAILFAFNQAKFGLMARADSIEHDTDLGFITPSPRYYRNIDSL